MKKFFSFIIAVLLFLLLPGGFIVGSVWVVKNLNACSDAKEKVALFEQEQARKESALFLGYSKWVYQNSYRISYLQAKQIVVEVFKYPYPELLLAIFAKESSFNPSALSSSGAIGLGQVLPTPERLAQLQISRRDLFEYKTNIRASFEVLKEKLKYANGDLPHALQLYLGANNKKYVHDILANLGELFLISSVCTSNKIEDNATYENYCDKEV